MKQYKVGNIQNDYELVYVLKTNMYNEIEKCIKDNLKKHAVKLNSNELIQLNVERIIETIEYCNKMEVGYLTSNTSKLKNSKIKIKKIFIIPIL